MSPLPRLVNIQGGGDNDVEEASSSAASKDNATHNASSNLSSHDDNDLKDHLQHYEDDIGSSDDDDLFSADGSGDTDPDANSISERSSMDGSSASSTNNFQNLSKDKEYDRAIKISRVVFFSFLIIAAGWLVYRGARQIEVEGFETKFETLAEEIFVASEEKVLKSIDGLKSLSTTLTMVMNYNEELYDQASQGEGEGGGSLNFLQEQAQVYRPGFVTLPDVEKQFASIRNVTDALIIAYMPLVSSEDLDVWNNYSDINQGWITKSNGGVNGVMETKPILSKIWDYAPDDDDRRRRLEEEEGCVEGDVHGRLLNTDEDEDPRVPFNITNEGPFAPIWMLSPPPYPNETDMINFDLFGKPVFEKAVKTINITRDATFLDVCNQAKWFGNRNHADELQTVIAYPVFDNLYDNDDNENGESSNSKIVGHLTAIIPWRIFFERILHGDDASKNITIVLENTCDEEFTIEIINHQANIASTNKDVHDVTYDYLEQSQLFAKFANPDFIKDETSDGTAMDGLEHCVYTIKAYPTKEFEESYLTSEPWKNSIRVLCLLLATAVFFFIFDCLVQRRQGRVLNLAMKQNAIVSSMFPKSVQAKMMAEVGTGGELSKMGKAGLKSFLQNDTSGSSGDKKSKSSSEGGNNGQLERLSKPIADLFPETTIMFADIAGFTAWSSTREPSMVFTLLETLYHAFDTTAKKRRVFKVETIGDCYVAVCGLPDPCRDHAVVMARFAYECLQSMHDMTRSLEVELGPDTTDLNLRVGLHSGSVVAGVLRGEKSRFQLFGDTMNTASRMESTGIPGRIQVSQETADFLSTAGKSRWLTPREDMVQVKGKGELSTYWLDLPTRSPRGESNLDELGISSHHYTPTKGRGGSEGPSKTEINKNRIDWTVEILAGLLKEIEARRQNNQRVKRNSQTAAVNWESNLMKERQNDGTTVLDEVEEIIMLPEFNAQVATRRAKQAGGIILDGAVMSELREYVQSIFSMYNDNPFHNSDHATHVTMSVTKLLGRIVAPDVDQLEEEVNNKSLHDHTYGITSDPLTRFSVVLSALIHDVDHDGVPNTQLVKENTKSSQFYKGKSVAEQNSVDLSWNLLMEPVYKNLRNQIYRSEDEYRRFRQLVVNTVMATDIMDKDLKKLRNDRWDKAFSIPPDEEKKDRRAVNRKATIVIEHLIQASDVAHTMQHWHVYRKWNEKLFEEMYLAYKEGRMENDPSIGWYKGEMGFFDFYIIPLAKKLFDCGVFGVSSHEYLSYAQQNRKEWEKRGEGIVADMVAKLKEKEEMSKKAYVESGGDLEGESFH